MVESKRGSGFHPTPITCRLRAQYLSMETLSANKTLIDYAPLPLVWGKIKIRHISWPMKPSNNHWWRQIEAI